MNKYHAVAELLKKRFGFKVDPCCCCLQDPKTIEHHFYLCSVTQQFWQNLRNWLGIRLENVTLFDTHQILIY